MGHRKSSGSGSRTSSGSIVGGVCACVGFTTGLCLRVTDVSEEKKKDGWEWCFLAEWIFCVAEVRHQAAAGIVLPLVWNQEGGQKE